MDNILYPFGTASTFTLTASGAQALTITKNMNIVDGVTTVATGERTINLTISSELKAGAIMLVKVKADTGVSNNTIFGTGMSGKTTAMVSTKTQYFSFIYDGTNFIQCAAGFQLD